MTGKYLGVAGKSKEVFFDPMQKLSMIAVVGDVRATDRLLKQRVA